MNLGQSRLIFSVPNLTANGDDCAANNNGNLLAQRISVPGVAGWDQHYFYDGVSRLTGVSENAVGGSGTTLEGIWGIWDSLTRTEWHDGGNRRKRRFNAGCTAP